MNLLLTITTHILVGLLWCKADFILFPTNWFYLNQETRFVCPESCPAENDPICASNGFCIKLFKSVCQLIYSNCKTDEEYRQVHQDYCLVERFKNLQPKACFNETIKLN